VKSRATFQITYGFIIGLFNFEKKRREGILRKYPKNENRKKLELSQV
jgi:hypothetical protein